MEPKKLFFNLKLYIFSILSGRGTNIKPALRICIFSAGIFETRTGGIANLIPSFGGEQCLYFNKIDIVPD